MDTNAAKEQLRGQLRTRRRAIGPNARRKAETALAQQLLALPEVSDATCIAAYRAYGSELSLNAVISELRLLDQPPRLVYPGVTSKTNMVFAELSARCERALAIDPKTIMKDIPSTQIVAAEEIDVMLVPGIAFDSSGARLGQGGGYYDRYLSQAKAKLVTIGIAFDEQLVDEVPCTTHDRKVTYIVTPTRIIAS